MPFSKQLTWGATFLVCAATAAGAQARNPRTVQPERPTVATHAGTVSPGFLELEWGAELNDASTMIPVYFKLGLQKNVQLGISTPYDVDNGFGAVGFAVKWRLADDAPLLGRFAVQPSVVLPKRGIESAVGALLISSHMLGSVAFDANLGVFASGGNTRELWTLSFGGPFSGKLGWVAEVSGTTSSFGNRRQLLVGPTYAWKNWLAFDAGVIVGLNTVRSTSFYVGGVTNFGRLVGR